MSYSAQGMAKVFRTHGKGKGIVGVEIGVDRGRSTKGLLDSCPNITKITAIDPWEAYPAIDQVTCDKNHAIAKENLRSYVIDGNIEIIRSKSLDAVNIFVDGSLDFVYIDGDHSYEAAYADVCAWFPKVKKGGIVSGHDFRPKDLEVRAAIRKFADDNGYEIMIEEDGWSWWFVK